MDVSLRRLWVPATFYESYQTGNIGLGSTESVVAVEWWAQGCWVTIAKTNEPRAQW